METTNEAGRAAGQPSAEEPGHDEAISDEAIRADEAGADVAEPAGATPVRDVHWLVPLALLIGATFLLGVSWGAGSNVAGAALGVAGLAAGGVLALRARAMGSASMFMPVMVGVAAAVMVVAQLLRWL